MNGGVMDPYMEDKKCRICGFADTKNVNIFSSHNCKGLLTKILAVYPIVLYENDPLPKNICKKCIYNVTFMYNDVQRVLKTQAKWISNVRSIQPNHSYIRVLDTLEDSNKITRESIKSSLGEDICPYSIDRLLKLSRPESSIRKESSAASSKSSSGSRTPSSTCATKGTASTLQPQPKDMKPKIAETSVVVPKSSDKSVTEQNGGTLRKVGDKHSTRDANGSSQSKRLQKQTKQDATKSQPTIKEEEVSDEELVETPASNFLPALPPLTVKCRYCPLQFNSLEALAVHQTVHLRISETRIFKRKYLQKSLRRGRLITVQDRKCIRCLNCWRIFVDNKSILGHWAQSECDFYCQICGKEFAHSARMLREHVPAAHGISYRSAKLQRPQLPANVVAMLEHASPKVTADYEVYKSVSEQEPPLCDDDDTPSTSSAIVRREEKVLTTSKSGSSTSSTSSKNPDLIMNEDGTVTCHICFKIFQNFKARNSHMRKHKYFGDGAIRADVSAVDAYMTDEPLPGGDKESPPATAASKAKGASNAPRSAELPTNSSQSSSSSSSATRSIVVRGVRTKFVSPRTDLTPAARIKVKSMHDLQTASASKPTATPTSTLLHADHVPYVIKEEPIDIDDGINNSMKTTPSDPSLQCPTCGEYQPAKMDLVVHTQHCRAAVRHTCEYCSKAFEYKTDYDLHMMRAHGKLCLN